MNTSLHENISDYEENNYTADATDETDKTPFLVSSRYVLQGILLTVIGGFGFLGNFASITYFSTGKKYRRQFEALMLWLAVFDNVFIICAFLAYALPEFSHDGYVTSGISAYTIPWIVPIAQVAATCNIYFTIAISVERYLVVCKPLFHRARSRSPKTYVIGILVFSIVYNLSKFFELETIVVDDEAGGIF